MIYQHNGTAGTPDIRPTRDPMHMLRDLYSPTLEHDTTAGRLAYSPALALVASLIIAAIA